MLKRLVILVLFCLVLGLIMNGVMALGSTLIAQQWPATGVPLTDDNRRAINSRFGITQGTMLTGQQFKGFGYREQSLLEFDTSLGAGPYGNYVEVMWIEAGWPFKSFERQAKVDLQKGTWHVRLMRTWSRMEYDWGVFTIPNEPILRGLVLNSLLYAVLLFFLVIVAPRSIRALRREVRIRAGLCPACAYPVGVRDFCTECGASVVVERSKFRRIDPLALRICAAHAAVYFAGGIIINVLLALGIAMVVQVASPQVRTPSPEHFEPIARRLDLHPMNPRLMYGSGLLKAPGYHELKVGAYVRMSGDWIAGTHSFIEIETGWPFRSLRYQRVRTETLASWSNQYLAGAGPGVASTENRWLVLPRYPIWHGFIVNSLLFTMLLFVGHTLKFAAMQHRKPWQVARPCAQRKPSREGDGSHDVYADR